MSQPSAPDETEPAKGEATSATSPAAIYVEAYSREKLAEYDQLVTKRSLAVYSLVHRFNYFLLCWGSVFLVVTLILGVWAALEPNRIDWRVPAFTSGLSLLQFVAVFFSKPLQNLQRNLNNMAAFKMVLDTHSLKTALARFHLTAPDTLREIRTEEEKQLALWQIEVFERAVGAIDNFDRTDFAALEALILPPEELSRALNSPVAREEAGRSAVESVETDRDRPLDSARE